MKQNNNKIFSIELMRILSILAVILIHTTSRTLQSVHYTLESFRFSLFINQLGRFAVPLFILISGFVLELNYHLNENFLTYFKKRAAKIIIPYIFWSLFYYLFIYNNNQENFIFTLLKGSASYQLYFIPTLCIFYIIFPLLHKFYKFIANPFVLLVLTALEIFLMYKDYFVQQFALPDPIRVFILSFIYFIAGIIMAKNHIKILKLSVKIKIIIISVLIGSVIYIYNEALKRYYITYNIEAFYSQWRIDVLIYTLTLFISFYGILGANDLGKKIISKLSKLSFLVFFIHVFVIEILWNLYSINLFAALATSNLGKVIFELIFFTSVSGISFLAAYILHKIKPLTKITG